MSDRFSTEDAKPKRMSSELSEWCDQGEPDERRTLILRLDSMADPERIGEDLADLDVEVMSSGKAVIVGNVARRHARAASELKGVVRLDEPAPMQEKTDDSLLSGPIPSRSPYTLPE